MESQRSRGSIVSGTSGRYGAIEQNIDDDQYEITEDDSLTDVKSSKSCLRRPAVQFLIFSLVFTGLCASIWGIVYAVEKDRPIDAVMPDLPVESENPGWGEYSEWTPCSKSCADGQQNRMRICTPKMINGMPDYSVCENYPESASQTRLCKIVECVAGKDVVKDTANNLRNKLQIEDNLFLDRYAQTTTNNGEVIDESGQGVWILNKHDIEYLLNDRLSRQRRDQTLEELGFDIVDNIKAGCDVELSDNPSVDDIVNLVETDPCASAISLITLVNLLGYYPVPISSAEQEKILLEVTQVIATKWEDTMDMELEDIQDSCSKADIDFEFVIDASGSIQSSNWKTTMEMISNYWVKSVIRPSGVDQCGNHIGARRFSSISDSFQVRFIDFEPPTSDDYKDFPNFAHYIGHKFENEPYTSGSSEIGEALRRVRVYDLPSARPGKAKFILVFTDGISTDLDDLKEQAAALKLEATVYAFGIGSEINQDELELIASSPDNIGLMKDFTEFDDLVRSFMLLQGGCTTDDTPSDQPWRAVNIHTTAKYGVSFVTGNGGGCSVSSMDCPSVGYEMSRKPECGECSRSLANEDLESMNLYRENITLATGRSCYSGSILAGLISRATRGGRTLEGGDGWVNCPNDSFTRCYGIAGLPGYENPDISNGIGGVEYLMQVIQHIEKMTSNIGKRFVTMTDDEKTRSGIAAYDCGEYQILSNTLIDYYTNGNDFSSDVLSRAEFFQENGF